MLSENTADAVEPRAGLAQPWRAMVAAAELVFVAALVVAAWWCWDRSQLAVEVSGATGGPMHSVRIFGDWAALGIAAPTLAAVLFVDAMRQLMLAWAVRRTRTARREPSS